MSEQKKAVSKPVLWIGALIGQATNVMAFAAACWIVLRAENVPTAIRVCAWVVGIFCVWLVAFTLISGTVRNTQKRNGIDV